MFVSRSEIQASQEIPRTTNPYLTKYEYTTLLGIRVQQLADGASPLVSIQDFDRNDPRLLWNMAEREILERKLPLILRRKLPGGNAEYWITDCP